MDVAQYLGDVRVVVGIDVRRLPGDDVERHHHDVFPFRFGVADQPVDQPCHVVAALLDALAERRKVRGGELADRLVVVYPRMAMSFGIREFPLDLEARLGDMVRLVVVAGHDGHRFGQRLQPCDELRRVVVPQVVLGAAAGDEKVKSGFACSTVSRKPWQRSSEKSMPRVP